MMKNLYQRMSEEKRRAFLLSLSPEEAAIFEAEMQKPQTQPWREIARPEQLMPEGDWFT
jgi:hypothetical protein